MEIEMVVIRVLSELYLEKVITLRWP